MSTITITITTVMLEVALRESEGAAGGLGAFVSRLSRSQTVITKPGMLQMSARGSLSNLRAIVQEERAAPGPTEAEIRVRAVGLNFRDVLNVMGLYPGDPGPPGADAAGTVLRVGSEITHIKPGDDVFGESPGCLRTYNTGPAALLTPKPYTWSYEEACTMPVIFVTVEESLADIAKLKKGESVLIHAAAGGVGLVAIQYAHFVGAEVFATAGVEEKHQFLRDLGVKYITSTRDGAKFEAETKEFLKKSGRKGIDVVINSLSHDDYIPRSLALLNQGGRFMEIGKRGIWSHEQMKEARPDVLYEKIAADTMMDVEPWRYNGYLKLLLKRVDEGGLSPINMHVTEGMEHGVKAMQYLQRAQNIGKVVISVPTTMQTRPDAEYLLSGGMGALGLVTAEYLVQEGAKYLSLLSRSGKPSADAKSLWDWLGTSSITVSARACDCAKLEAVQELAAVMKKEGASRSPQTNMGAIIHLAAVLDDATFPKLTPAHLSTSFGAKVWGARHLKLVMGSGALKPEYMLLFSSTSALLGSPGQANYSASNASLDAHAYYWRQQGEQAWSVQWGPWREVGMAAQKGTVERLKAQGVGSLSNAIGMAALSSTLSSGTATIVAQPMRWGTYLKQYPKIPPFLARFAAEAKTEKKKAAAPAMGGMMMAAAPSAPQVSERDLRGMLQTIASEVAGGGQVEVDTPLMEAGMDSLSAVEFRNRFTSKVPGVNLPNTLIFDYPTIASISQFAAGQMGPATAGPPGMMMAAPAAPGVSPSMVKELLKRIASETTGGSVEEDKPLMESGMDSLSAVEFRNRLTNELPALNLPNTLIFDYPTIGAVAEYAVGQLGAVEGAPTMGAIHNVLIMVYYTVPIIY